MVENILDGRPMEGVTCPEMLEYSLRLLVCICWFNPRNTIETVSFPRRQKSGDTDWINRTGFRVWLQTIAGDCSMDADSSMVDNRERNTFGMDLFVPWDAPESVVDVSLASVVPLRDLPDGMGMVGRQKDATESRILQGSGRTGVRPEFS